MIPQIAVASILASAAAALPTTSGLEERTIGKAGRVTNFADVPARPDLHWTPCYGKFHCANLEVPLDYENKALGSTTVAWIRQDVQNSTSKTDIIFNPGGPGGSGIDTILSGTGDVIMKATGYKYNVVSFDPRGVNNSGIALTCFPNNPKMRDLYAANSGTGSTEQEKYAEAVAIGKWCTNVSKSNISEIRYAGTSAVVQDMMHFTELQSVKDGKKAEDARIWYYGVSYGTVIGQTLAQMYPNRLGRIILDANVQGDDHYNGLTDTAVEDADDGMEYFFKLCAEAGPKKCAFAGNSKDAADIKKRFNALLEKLQKTPPQAIDPRLGYPRIVTKNEVLLKIFDVLYSPGHYFPIMAKGLDYLEKDNATGWIITASDIGGEETPGPNNYTSAAAGEVLTLVTATDAAGRYPIKNVDEYTKAVDEIEKTSVWFGEGYAGLNPLINAGMNIQPPKSQLFTGFKKVKTSVPVLFVNTNADPITPLASAKHMSQYYEGSTVLVQNSGGHSFLGLTGKCMLDYIQNYLAKGEVPKDGTVCEAGWKPMVETRPKMSKRDSFVPYKRWA